MAINTIFVGVEISLPTVSPALVYIYITYNSIHIIKYQMKFRGRQEKPYGQTIITLITVLWTATGGAVI